MSKQQLRSLNAAHRNEDLLDKLQPTQKNQAIITFIKGVILKRYAEAGV